MLSRLSRISRHISLPLTPSRHALLFTRLGSTSAIRTAAKPRTRKKRVQEVVQLEDLPAFKVDLAGQRLEPMEPYVETKGGRPQTSSGECLYRLMSVRAASHEVSNQRSSRRSPVSSCIASGRCSRHRSCQAGIPELEALSRLHCSD